MACIAVYAKYFPKNGRIMDFLELHGQRLLITVIALTLLGIARYLRRQSGIFSFVLRRLIWAIFFAAPWGAFILVGLGYLFPGNWLGGDKAIFTLGSIYLIAILFCYLGIVEYEKKTGLTL